MDVDRLKRRVAGRQQAKDVIDILSLPHPDMVDGFLNEIASILKPVTAEDSAKSRIEKQRVYAEFACHRLGFGKYKGVPLENVPRDFLEWLLESSEETVRMVGGYLESTEDCDGNDRS